MTTNQNNTAVTLITKGDTKGINLWADQVKVPDEWNTTMDINYVEEEFGSMSREGLVDQLLFNLEDFRDVLTFAYCFLTGQPYESDGIFRHHPLGRKVELLRRLFQQRNQEAGYLERFEQDLQAFLDVETVCMPILTRHLLAPESVWLRELLGVRDCVCCAASDFAESLTCEHDECPRFSGAATAAMSPGPKRTATQTIPSGDLGRYRAEANLTLAAVVEFAVAARDASHARQRAEVILHDCEPKIEVRVPTGETMVVCLLPDNVSTELLEIVKDLSPSDSADIDAAG
jgi:hypothetical protein